MLLVLVIPSSPYLANLHTKFNLKGLGMTEREKKQEETQTDYSTVFVSLDI